MLKRKGFTLIELMIVVVIIGMLASLAIPRFMKASKKAKKSEACIMLKHIYSAAQIYFQENGGYPPCKEDGSSALWGVWYFNNSMTKNINWNPVPGLTVDRPSGYPRFTYVITRAGSRFRAEAWSWSPDSYDASMRWAVQDMIIHEDGTITYAGAKPGSF